MSAWQRIGGLSATSVVVASYGLLIARAPEWLGYPLLIVGVLLARSTDRDVAEIEARRSAVPVDGRNVPLRLSCRGP